MQSDFDRPTTDRNAAARCLVLMLILLMLTGCAARQVQDSLAGSTAQRLVTQSIDNLAGQLPDSDFAGLAGQTVYLESHFIDNDDLKRYADRRLAFELESRFDITVSPSGLGADRVLTVFYTSLGTDQGHVGFFLPLGMVPGVAEDTRINLITIEQFHGVAELYYFLGPPGEATRSEILRSRIRTDALGLPIITIPISTLD